MRTLRGWLVASHIGLLLLVIPLVGLALVYGLESRVVLASLASQLAGEASLVAELAAAEPALWRDPQQAAAFVARISPLVPGDLTLLTTEGVVLASSHPQDADAAGQVLVLPGLEEAAQGERLQRVLAGRAANRGGHVDVVDALVPVLGAGGQVAGIVRLHEHLTSVQALLHALREPIVGVLLAGLGLGALVGLGLALAVERPLARLTQGVAAYSAGGALRLPPASGPAELRALQGAFEHLVQALNEQEAVRSRLLANLVHELGRPLGALRAAGQALLDGAVDEPALRDELLTGMDGEIRRMDRLLDDLVELGQRASGPPELVRQPVDLAAWLPGLLSPWAAAARAAGLAWQATLPGDLPTLCIDPDRLGQALGNLLSNALKFTPRGGAVTVSSGVVGEAWIWRVADSGPGIASEEQGAIFDPFYRVPAGRHYPPGLGLGLTIARAIVQAHGGDLAVESQPNAGAAFTVRLPLAAALPHSPPPLTINH